MIAAPVGTQVDGFTVAPACGEAGRYPLCLTHGNTFPDPAELAKHLRKAPGGLQAASRVPPCVLASLCVIHGPEATRKP